MSYSIEIKGLEELRKSFAQAPQKVAPILEKATKKAGALIVKTEKEFAPVKTGNLRRSIELEYSPIQVRITPTAKYATYVNFGTGINVSGGGYIYTKRGKVMVFNGRNGMVFARKTKGQKANPFIEKTRDQVFDNANLIFTQALNEIINTI